MKLFFKIILLFFLLFNYTFTDNKKDEIFKNYNKIYNRFWEKTITIIEKILNEKIEKDWKNNIIDYLSVINNEKSFNNVLEKQEKNTKKILVQNILTKNFKIKLLNDYWLVKENWVWYYYYFENYSTFNDNNFTKKDLEHNSIDYNYLLSVKDNKIIFVKNFQKYRLVSDHIIYWIPWKLDVLKDLIFIKSLEKKDENLDRDFMILKKLSKDLTKWIDKKEEIIKTIYNYILENLTYDENYNEKISKWEYDIFSWIKSFKNKIWVCQWYVEMFNLMLAFNNIKSEIIKGDVINSKDFPNIWHAWVKIDNFYYDPTFDDPIWNKKTKKFQDYFYYKLPKDLFYTNRFNRGETPEFLKKLKLNQRQTYVDLNIFNLSNKYENWNFNILNLVHFKKSLWLSAKQEIKLEDLINKFWINSISSDWKTNINWLKKYILKMEYVELNQENLLWFLYQIKFKFDWYKLFKTSDWKIFISNNYSFR